MTAHYINLYLTGIQIDIYLQKHQTNIFHHYSPTISNAIVNKTRDR